jgi:hypothetical protein
MKIIEIDHGGFVFVLTFISGIPNNDI